uniref:Uncharacterized protein n=1 Tax=Quercus lobata TaxID=97700 RepID=A0A7N2KNI7_QUELO
MEPLATRYPIGDSVTMASHFPFASTFTHPNHSCTLCSDGLIPGGLVFDHVMEVWDPPDTINLGMMCSARVTSRSHCTEFTSLGMEGFGKTTISDIEGPSQFTSIQLGERLPYMVVQRVMQDNQQRWGFTTGSVLGMVQIPFFVPKEGPST